MHPITSQITRICFKIVLMGIILVIIYSVIVIALAIMGVDGQEYRPNQGEFYIKYYCYGPILNNYCVGVGGWENISVH